jgi:hypothetical protein
MKWGKAYAEKIFSFCQVSTVPIHTATLAMLIATQQRNPYYIYTYTKLIFITDFSYKYLIIQYNGYHR